MANYSLEEATIWYKEFNGIPEEDLYCDDELNFIIIYILSFLSILT
ncbi:hypothetical protein [Halalkalibacter sp. APA_J-10(15)]|nr:hypothetical protein [Halalkalibacter sp. APA_J-10(15)]MCK0470905.1 hypothetical protein [Halalkalibacter sp. APA_J-10(15)]